ncbi:MAG: hypothetical protein QXJ48_01125 [Candidatus Korarchaeum sp.]
MSYALAVIVVPYLKLPELVVELGYLGIFALGLLYVYTFTTAIATLTLIFLAEELNLILGGVMAGLGAFLGDLILSYLMKGLSGELYDLLGERPVRSIESKLPTFIRSGKFILFLACLLIAAPLPTELGAVMLASMREMPMRNRVLIMGSLHTIGIFSILILGAL